MVLIQSYTISPNYSHSFARRVTFTNISGNQFLSPKLLAVDELTICSKAPACKQLWQKWLWEWETGAFSQKKRDQIQRQVTGI